MYKFKTSERNNDKATEYETKSLLYLLTKIKGQNNVDLFIIDCFNDVTGVSESYSDSWDVQSKNVASLTPRTVGKALYTLFANYVSDISFGHYIIYLPPLKNSYVKDSTVETFDISNFKSENVANVELGLRAEIDRRNDADVNTPDNLSKLKEFISKVVFVSDRYGKSEYIKSIIEFKNVDRLNDEFLVRIFDEIRAQQTAKKIQNIYGQEVASIQDAEKFEKNIYRKDIELLIVNRVIGNDLFTSKGVPISFLPEIQGMDEDDIADVLQDCQAKISRTIFNKNNKKAFWVLLEEIMTAVAGNKNAGIRVILGKLNIQPMNRLFTMDESSLLYLIALVKEGFKNENP